MSDTVKKAAADAEKRAAEMRKRTEAVQEAYGKYNASMEEGREERAAMVQDLDALDRAMWPYTGLYAPPAPPRLHVIPTGMWRYALPLTPAPDSVVPPSPEADPNFALLEKMEKGFSYMVDTQAEDEVAAQRAKQAADEESRTPPPTPPRPSERQANQGAHR